MKTDLLIILSFNTRTNLEKNAFDREFLNDKVITKIH